MQTMFVNIILPLPLPNVFTYRVPRGMEEDMEVGKRVVVQFGRSKFYSGIIETIHGIAPTEYQAKYVDYVVDEVPIVTPKDLTFWRWVSDYYMCAIGEVMGAALPSQFKLSSDTRLVYTGKEFTPSADLGDNAYLLVEALESASELTAKDIQGILNTTNVYKVVKGLIDAGYAVYREDIADTYKPKVVKYVRIPEPLKSDEALKNVFEALERAPKQLDVLMSYIQLSRLMSEKELLVKKKDLVTASKSTSGIVAELVKKNFLEEYERRSEWEIDEGDFSEVKLSDYQQEKYEEINALHEEKSTVLLHGITGSGKTEVYVKMIKDQLAKGNQVLFLLPEIALTTQIIGRLKKFFGDNIGVYHSRFNARKRADLWKRMSSDKPYDIVLGARSSLFVPFKKLGLVIVDEEHENTFKQFEPAPRYHARDCAIYLAATNGAKVVLGSATPSMESFANVHNNKFGYVEMKKRFGNATLPEVLTADLQDEMRKRKMKGHFSSFLIKQMEEALLKEEQIILFQNRRGYSPYVQCDKCGWVDSCTRCDVSLTFHKGIDKCKCHYCGFTAKVSRVCGECGSHELSSKGFGTEKIAEQIKEIFPKARVSRLDLDTTRTKNAYEDILGDFENRAVDILIGTQMVTKGLDFDNVGLVGVLSADSMLSFPDFRAFERSYQLMSQVAGRAGRKEKKGKVVIQAYNPYHPIIQDVIKSDYRNMYKSEVIDRRNFKYPPFYKMIKFTLKHRDRPLVDEVARVLVEELKKVFGSRVLGPEYPAVSRVNNVYQKNIMLKVEPSVSMIKAKEKVRECMLNVQSHKPYRPVRILLDVDPY